MRKDKLRFTMKVPEGVPPLVVPVRRCQTYPPTDGDSPSTPGAFWAPDADSSDGDASAATPRTPASRALKPLRAWGTAQRAGISKSPQSNVKFDDKLFIVVKPPALPPVKAAAPGAALALRSSN